LGEGWFGKVLIESVYEESLCYEGRGADWGCGV
jgi:hypothetical protein